MAGRADERPEALAARRAYLDRGDVHAALGGIHQHAVAERAILEVCASEDMGVEVMAAVITCPTCFIAAAANGRTGQSSHFSSGHVSGGCAE